MDKCKAALAALDGRGLQSLAVSFFGGVCLRLNTQRLPNILL
jgi:hypothetical protein